jgi:hypothetical protein
MCLFCTIYNLHVFEECNYYSTYYAGAITISNLFEECHYVRLTASVGHGPPADVLVGSYIHMDKIALARFIFLVLLTCRTHTSGASSTSRRCCSYAQPFCSSAPRPEPGLRGGDGAEAGGSAATSARERPVHPSVSLVPNGRAAKAPRSIAGSGRATVVPPP